MESRPKVFLSHSKKDQKIIEKIAFELGKYKIDVWYDDWEIDPGDSLRSKIFEDGIPNCNLFFVYLTKNSIDSPWVKRELDASFIEQSRNKGFNIVTFVDYESTREQVPIDLGGMNLAVINEEEFYTGFIKLVSSAYQNKVKSIIYQKNLAHENEILKLEREIEKLRNYIQSLNKSNETFEEVLQKLREETVDIEGQREQVLKLLKLMYKSFATGVTGGRIENFIDNSYDTFGILDPYTTREMLDEFITPLYLHSILDIQRATDERDTHYYLTEFGAKFVKYLNENNQWLNMVENR